MGVLPTGAEPYFILQLLENLVVAMESEAQVIDISRVSGFMQKVRSMLMLMVRRQ